jgi:hypothetical protein
MIQTSEDCHDVDVDSALLHAAKQTSFIGHFSKEPLTSAGS